MFLWLSFLVSRLLLSSITMQEEIAELIIANGFGMCKAVLLEMITPKLCSLPLSGCPKCHGVMVGGWCKNSRASVASWPWSTSAWHSHQLAWPWEDHHTFYNQLHVAPPWGARGAADWGSPMPTERIWTQILFESFNTWAMYVAICQGALMQPPGPPWMKNKTTKTWSAWGGEVANLSKEKGLDPFPPRTFIKFIRIGMPIKLINHCQPVRVKQYRIYREPWGFILSHSQLVRGP